jgi:uncharacterized protein YbjT (DUF2867 family)
MILLTGASGTVGGAVLHELRRSGAAFKAMYRSEIDAAKAPAGTQRVIADFANKDSLRGAVVGVDEVFLVCAPIPQLVELEGNMIDVCQEEGVRGVVLNSSLGAGDYDKSFPSWHAQVEQKLQGTKLNYVMLRPNGFMQNIVAFDAPTIRAQGAFYAALDAAKISLVDVRDVGAAAARILSAPETHAGKTYELNGPEAVTSEEVAARISRIVGRTVKYVDVPEQALRESMVSAGTPEWLATALVDLQRYYVTGKCAQATDVLPKLLGRPSRTLDQFLEENEDAFRAQAAAV